ncbi:kinase-like domain-containing protein [Haematococcus lacustris]
MSEAEPLAQHPMYCKIRTVGRGQRSFVQVARNKATNELVAIRFIPRGWEPSHTKYVARAILNHQELSLSKHPHVVEFKEVFLTSRYLAEVLEYVEGETLQVFLEKVGGKVIEGLARFIFQQLIIALDFCHRKGKVNRDIKLSNILLSIAEGQLPLVKLCDFGFSKDTFRHSEPHSQVGTALFVAPEVMQNFTGGNYNGQAADVWACGVCVFIMLFGRHPYLRPADNQLSEQQQMIKLFQRMMQDEMEFPSELVSSLSPECLDLLRRMLKTRPGQRATMSDIQNHPWFRTALPEGANLMNGAPARLCHSLQHGPAVGLAQALHSHAGLLGRDWLMTG